MSITITDPALLEQFLNAEGKVDVTDPDGIPIGFFSTEGLFKLPPGVKSPFTDEEMAERRKDKTGRKLADIMRDLEARS